MATAAIASIDSDARFQLKLTGLMALIFVAAFSTNIVLGRSSFGAPVIVHLHALVFFGWVALTLLQTGLAVGGNLTLHRRLGWLAVGWIIAMVPLGTAVTVHIVQAGRAPFFFQPQRFLIDNPLNILAFAGIAGAALVLRRQTGWHRRLQLCALAAVMGPAFGRLLPLPFVTPYAFIVAGLPGLLFPALMAWREYRRDGHVHPAWAWGTAPVPLTLALSWVLAASPIGAAVYRAVTAGTPGAAVAGMAFGLPPG